MNTLQPTDQRPAWSWADQLSSYRFWGLMFFYFFAGISVSAVTSGLGYFILNQKGLSASMLSGLNIARLIGFVYGFILAWAAARWRTKAILFVMAALTLIGAMVLYLPGEQAPLFPRYLGAFLMGCGGGAMTIITPALIAGGRGGAEAYILTFGLLSVMSIYYENMSMILAGALIDAGISLTPFVAIMVIIGCIFLAPVKGAFFDDAPSRRAAPFPPEFRNPWTVGLLCLVPFVYLYWLYRFHGESAWLAPAREILTPTPAVLGAIFVPFLTFVMPVKLIDALNTQASVLGMSPLRKSWVVFLWSIFFYPVAFGMVQSALNQLAAVERSYAPAA